MKGIRHGGIVAALFLLSVVGHARAAGPEVAVLGGVQVLNKNDTALPDRLVNVPAVASIGYRITPVVAVDGEFTWMIPVQQSVDLGSGVSQDRKTPHVLAYQANLRANWTGSPAWSPYLVAGAGGLTFLSSTDADRVPQLADSETMFALDFGAGVDYGIRAGWALRADFREFVGFPSDHALGFSNSTGADKIWMERGTMGLAYRF